MPWKECHVVDERLRFIARLRDGEKMAAPLRRVRDLAEDRLQDLRALRGLWAGGADRSEPAAVSAGQSAAAAGRAGIVRLKREYPNWGAPKIRERLRRRGRRCPLPAISTVHAVLDRHGLVTRRRRRRSRAEGTPCRGRPRPMISGVPTTRASSCWPIGATAIRSPSPTCQRAICSRATRSRRRGDVRLHGL